MSGLTFAASQMGEPMVILKPISRRGFVKKSVQGGMPALAALHQPADEGTAAPSSAPPDKLRFGANYVPRKRWWYCWQDWDQQAIAEDLSAVADLSLDHIRIQCLWPIFQE
jgi:hypothetical protein